MTFMVSVPTSTLLEVCDTLHEPEVESIYALVTVLLDIRASQENTRKNLQKEPRAQSSATIVFTLKEVVGSEVEVVIQCAGA